MPGCATRKVESNEPGPDMSFWKPHQLYLQAAPHPRLYVEVDAVKGCEPSDARLKKLKEFLTTYCQKPDGIEIVRGDVIPVKEAKGVPLRALTRHYLTGPPKNTNGPAPAFLYVLYYDGRLSEPLVTTSTSETNKATPVALARNEKPHVDFLPYPAAMYINTRYFHGLGKHESVMLHEAGHVLGLAGRTTGATNNHCQDPNCLMYHNLAWSIPRFLLWKDPIGQHELCAQCQAELAEDAQLPASPKLRFIGPVLVRSEEGYHVLNFPFQTAVIIGSLNDADIQEFIDWVRAEKSLPVDTEGNMRGYASIKDQERPDVARLNYVFTRAKADPLKLVRELAIKLEEAVKAKGK